uniref:Uncharacterized protein n=1 Tax=Castor canadensis TaxID=51338 RepID=A0A8C0X9G6_CASCN
MLLAFCYMVVLLLTAAFIFFTIWHIIASDEMRIAYKNPIQHVSLCSKMAYTSSQSAPLGTSYLEVYE